MSGSFGDWQLEALLAVGGLGEVWRARHGDTIAALKRLHTHLARNAEATRQFAVEQHLTTTLPPHPNVVRGLAAGMVDERPFVALELVAGADLRATPALALPRILQMVAAACDGAAHLHAAGYIHGDICPGNLMIDRDGDRVILVDLGVARRTGEAGAVRGTHAYMAPEQVRGESWTPATDVFALGVVLWELVAHARLFHRGPPWLTMAAVVEDPVPPLDDPKLDAIARAALAKNPAERTQSATELAMQLRG